MSETVKGLNIKLGLDTTDLDTKFKDIKSELKEQTADLKSINTALKYDSNNVDLWKNKQATLNTTLDQTKSKLEVQNKRLEEAKKAVEIGAMSEAEFKKMERSVTYTEAEVAKLNNEMEKTNKKVTELGNAKWDKLASAGSSLTKNLTVPIVAVTSALTALSVKAMYTADEIYDNSTKVKLSAEAYQEWAHASKILAVDQAQMQKAFVKVNAMLGDIAMGNGGAFADSLDKIGVSLDDLNGLTTDEAFTLLRDKLSEVGDEATRTAIANQIFGDKIGSELAQLIGATSEEIQNLRDETHELGIVTDEQAELAGEFTDCLDKTKLALNKVATELAVQVIPTFMVLIDKFREEVIPIMSKAISYWENLEDKTKALILGITAFLAVLGPAMVIIGKVVPLIKGISAGIGILKTSLMALGGAVSLSTLGIGALIGVLAYLLVTNDEFKAVLADLVGVVQVLLGVIVEVVGTLLDALKPVLDVIIEVFQMLVDVVVNLIMQLIGPLTTVIEVVAGVLMEILPVVQLLITQIVDALIPVIELIVTLLDPLLDIVTLIIDVLADLIQVLVVLLGDVLQAVIPIIELLGNVLTVVIEVLSVLINVLMQILMPILELLFAILEPVIQVLGVIIKVIGVLMEALGPLIHIFLMPLMMQLEFIVMIFNMLAPIITTVANIISAVLVPVIEVLFTVLEPILKILTAIIDAISWVLDKLSSGFSWITDIISDIAGAFTGNVNVNASGSSGGSSNSVSTVNNQVTVNTTSSTFDIDSINKALGDGYL